MAGPSWNDDSAADEYVVAANVATILKGIVASAVARTQPSLDLAHDWHRSVYRGVASVPKPSYLGQPRGSDDPDLRRYEVGLRDQRTGAVVASGLPPALVAVALTAFESSLVNVTGILDHVIPVAHAPADKAQLRAVIQFAAQVHGEWVRIHPYANGNGRVARLWANWVAVRYGLPPFVRVKPRPDGLLYAQAAQRRV